MFTPKNFSDRAAKATTVIDKMKADLIQLRQDVVQEIVDTETHLAKLKTLRSETEAKVDALEAFSGVKK